MCPSHFQTARKYFAVIPARYRSKRFPGKPLALINGNPMFWHVYSRAKQCPLIEKIWLATDDQRIYNRANELEIPAVMTSEKHASGTDRILEAADTLDLPPECVIANVQGDEPALHPDMLTQLLNPFEVDPELKVSTLARQISRKEAGNPNTVKVVRSDSGRARYFSRSLVPYIACEMHSFLGHIGIYAYTYNGLKKFSSLGPGSLERSEKLEQLRLLQAGIDIQVVMTEHTSFGVDCPEDIRKIEKILQENQ